MIQLDLFATEPPAPANTERIERVQGILSACRKSSCGVSDESIRHYEDELKGLES